MSRPRNSFDFVRIKTRDKGPPCQHAMSSHPHLAVVDSRFSATKQIVWWYQTMTTLFDKPNPCSPLLTAMLSKWGNYLHNGKTRLQKYVFTQGFAPLQESSDAAWNNVLSIHASVITNRKNNHSAKWNFWAVSLSPVHWDIVTPQLLEHLPCALRLQYIARREGVSRNVYSIPGLLGYGSRVGVLLWV